MGMDNLFDEMARIFASQMPRRRAFKLVGGAIVAGIFGTAGATRAGAQGCGPNQMPCAASGKDKCCPSGQTCCTTCSNKGPFCNAPANKKCPATTQVCP